MVKHNESKKAVATATDLWPTWASRLNFPDLWQAFAGPEMKVEEFRDNGSIVVRAEIPGVDPDKDIDVTVKDGVLRIEAQRSRESSHEDDRSYRSEFRYGSFARMIHLPPGAAATDVKASYSDGVLEVRVPMDDTAADTQKVAIARA